MAKDNIELSEQAQKAKEKIETLNKKKFEDHKAFVKAVRAVDFASREKALTPYRQIKAEYKSQNAKERDKLWEQLEEYVQRELLRGEAAAYVEWYTGMMKLLASCALLNAALFSYNASFSDLMFYWSQRESVAQSIGLSKDKTMSAVKGFFGATGAIPTNFDPKFSMYAQMNDGLVYGKLFSGADAEEVVFTQYGSDPTPTDIFVEAYLKEKTEYELILDSESPLYRKVVKKEDDPSKVIQFLLDNPDAVSQIKLQAAEPELLPEDRKPYQLHAKAIKQNATGGGYVIVAEAKYLYKDEHNKDALGKETIEIPISDPTILVHGGHFFSGQSNHPDKGFAIDYSLPAAQLTSQEELDEIIGDDFVQYCEIKINGKITNFHGKVRLDLDSQGRPTVEVVKVINGKELPIAAATAQTIQQELATEMDEMIHNQPQPPRIEKVDGKLQYTSKYQMPSDDQMTSFIKHFVEANYQLDWETMEVDYKNKKVYIKDILDNTKHTINFKLEQTEDSQQNVKVSFSGAPMEGKSFEEAKTKKLLSKEELNAEFAPRLESTFEEHLSTTIEGLNEKPLKLLAYNPQPLSPSPSPKP
jgi:hypothetical protein